MLKMLVLKMLMLKKRKKYSLLAGMTQNKQKPYFHCGPSNRTSSKSTKKS